MRHTRGLGLQALQAQGGLRVLVYNRTGRLSKPRTRRGTQTNAQNENSLVNSPVVRIGPVFSFIFSPTGPSTNTYSAYTSVRAPDTRTRTHAAAPHARTNTARAHTTTHTAPHIYLSDYSPAYVFMSYIYQIKHIT
ncbi:hypothetical protein EVAR_42048_1 [Eumeta japonica]|uniref:Uncharacterized protein n=1 Tax=Eumeta variegata TaxID=151549 RepID=A0A4C1Y8E2_EUMVA|nr:hypothetical protein EVAR_42048_1 [Eumeta japonica]